MDTGEQKNIITTEQLFVESVSYSSDGHTLAIGCSNGTVAVLDVATGIVKKQYTGHRLAVTQVAFNADNTLLTSRSKDGVMYLWDVVE